MRIVASDEARDLIAARGGRLFVTVRAARCCGGARTLRAATEPPAREFRRAGGDDGVEVFVPQALERLPEELHVALVGRRRRLEAYWDGCAWIV